MVSSGAADLQFIRKTQERRWGGSGVTCASPLTSLSDQVFSFHMVYSPQPFLLCGYKEFRMEGFTTLFCWDRQFLALQKSQILSPLPCS